MENPLGIVHFVGQVDMLGWALRVILAAMSLTTWYLVGMKAALWTRAGRRSRRFINRFASAASVEAIEQDLANSPADEPFSQLAHRAIAAARHHDFGGAVRLQDFDDRGEFLTRAIRRGIDEQSARFESGLTVLASIGSTAPFIGLFGTVWGVYQALVAIGLSGEGSLDKVAGPVGEALIMTALGLAVAIPAVLAYNLVLRRNRVVVARLDAFAHDLYALLTTGMCVPQTWSMRARQSEKGAA